MFLYVWVNLYGPSPVLSKFLNIRSVSVSHMTETSFDPELAAMAGLPFLQDNTNIFAN
jgi:hypothetical protein